MPTRLLRSPSGAIEDWNVKLRSFSRTIIVAVALRGDRGLERAAVVTVCDELLVAVALRGDRGLEPLSIHGQEGPGVAVALRGDRGLEQRQKFLPAPLLALRSPFGAIEDWNTTSGSSW